MVYVCLFLYIYSEAREYAFTWKAWEQKRLAKILSFLNHFLKKSWLVRELRLPIETKWIQNLKVTKNYRVLPAQQLLEIVCPKSYPG